MVSDMSTASVRDYYRDCHSRFFLRAFGTRSLQIHRRELSPVVLQLLLSRQPRLSYRHLEKLNSMYQVETGPGFVIEGD